MAEDSGDGTYPPVIAEFLGDISDLAAKAQEAGVIVETFQDQANGLAAPALMAEELAPAPEQVEESGLSTGHDLGQAIAQGEEQALAEADTSAGAAAAAQELGAAMTPAAHDAGLAAGAEAADAMGQGLSAGSAAAGQAAAPQLGGVFDQMVSQAAAAGQRAGREFTDRLSDTVGQDLNDAEYDQFLMELAQAAGGQDAVDSLAASWERMSAAEADAAGETELAGDAAKDASVKWAALALAAAGVEFGIGAGVLGLSAAILGAGYLIADFGGEAKGDLQEVEQAFRSSAEQASQSYSGATQSITQDLVGMARGVEPSMAEMFQELSGPAEDFFSGLETSAEAGMNALVPAIGQMAPLISSISADLEPLVTGVAGFIQDMAAAFEAGGGQQELATLAQEIGTLLPVVGELVGEVGSGLLPIAIALTPPLQALGDILNALGPGFTTAAAGAYLAYQGWNQLGNASDALIRGYTSLSDWITRAEEAMAAEAAASGAAAAADAGQATAAGAAATATEAQAAASETEAAAAGTAAEATAAEAVALEAEGAAAAEAAIETEGAAVAMDAAGLGAFAMAAEVAASMAPLALFIAAVAAVGYGLFELGAHYQDVGSFFSGIGHDITSGLGSASTDLGEWGQSVIATVESPFTTLPDVMHDDGVNIVAGLVRGITDMEQAALAPIEAIAHGITGAFGDIMGIASPSTVMYDQGIYTGQGLVGGINDSRSLVEAASRSLGSSVLTGLGASGSPSQGSYGSGGVGAGASGGGAIYVTQNFYITQPLGTPEAIGAAVLPAAQQLNIDNGGSMLSHNGLKG